MGRIAASVLEKLYPGARAERAWTTVLDTIVTQFDAAAIAVVVVERATLRAVLCDCCSLLQPSSATYTSRYLRQDARIPRLIQGDRRVVRADDLLTDAERDNCPIVRELLRPRRIGDCLLAKLEIDGPRAGFIALCRDARKGPFPSSVLDDIGDFADHVSVALRLRLRLDAPLSDRGAHAPKRAGLYFVDERMRLLGVGLQGQDMLGQGSTFEVRGGRLHARTPDGDRAMKALVASSRATERGRRCVRERRTARLTCTCGCPLLLMALPASETVPAAAYDPHTIALFAIEGASASVVEAGMLRTLYGLTPMESHIAAGIANGGTLAETASRLKVSRNTAKTHLRGAFYKTGTSNQAELRSTMLSQLEVIGPLLRY